MASTSESPNSIFVLEITTQLPQTHPVQSTNSTLSFCLDIMVLAADSINSQGASQL